MNVISSICDIIVWYLSYAVDDYLIRAIILRTACYICAYNYSFLIHRCILNVSACKDNLDSFINMESGAGLGIVMSLKQLVNRFYRPNVNTQAPTPLQP